MVTAARRSPVTGDAPGFVATSAAPVCSVVSATADTAG